MVVLKSKSNFSFVNDHVLRDNIDIAFDLVVELIPLSNSKEYSELIKSSFRKLIIISTASIIEALILYILKNNKTEEELSSKTIEIKEIKRIYEINKETRIILVEDYEKIKSCKFEKLNLQNLIDLCKEHKLLNKEILDLVSGVKDLRNKQHIGTLKHVDGGYSQKDLEFVFFVASRVKKLASKI